MFLTAAFVFAHLLALATPVLTTTMIAMSAVAEATPVTMKLSSVPFVTLDQLVTRDFGNVSCVRRVSIKSFQVRRRARSVFQDMTAMEPITFPTMLLQTRCIAS